MKRCLMCKAFIQRGKRVDCKRCGAVNVDATISVPPTQTTGLFAYRVHLVSK